MVDPLEWDAEASRVVDGGLSFGLGAENTVVEGGVVTGEVGGPAPVEPGVDPLEEDPVPEVPEGPVDPEDAVDRAELDPSLADEAVAVGDDAAVLRAEFSFFSCPGGPLPSGPRPFDCPLPVGWLAAWAGGPFPREPCPRPLPLPLLLPLLLPLPPARAATLGPAGAVV